MELALLAAAVLAAGLACPAVMWWQRRRGREAACRAPLRPEGSDGQLEALRERQRELAARIAAEEAACEKSETGR